MSSRNTFTPEDLAKRKRANIQRMLYDTFLEEYENPSSFACYVRFYKMDQKRYEENKDFTITVQFGDNLNVTQRSEAYVYDVNDLLQEGFLMPEKRICYIPVPIGKKRWDKLKRLVGDLTPYSNAEGRLDYPLTRAEISTLLANIHVQPIVCSTMEGCNPLAKISNPIYLWGTVPPQTQPVIQEWVIPPPSSNSEIDIKVDFVSCQTNSQGKKGSRKNQEGAHGYLGHNRGYVETQV